MPKAIDMKIRELGLKGVKEIIPQRFGDERGFFSETYNQAAFQEAGLPANWVQDNHSLSSQKNVLRGLHFQTEPFAQDKLVRVVSGEIYDVAVDIRKGSPDYGKWVGLTVSAKLGNQILIPKGFAHGFLTLAENVEVEYKVSAPYSPPNDCTILWNDPAIGIDWPFSGDPILSKKDKEAALLGDVENNFFFENVRPST